MFSPEMRDVLPSIVSCLGGDIHDQMSLAGTCKTFYRLVKKDPLVQRKRDLVTNNRQAVNLKLMEIARLGFRDLIYIFGDHVCWQYALDGACRGGHRDIVDLFFEREKYYFDYHVAICEALRGGHRELVYHLRRHSGVEFEGGNPYLYCAAEGGHRELIDYVISKMEVWNFSWNDGLAGAARGGHWDLVHWFIERGANSWSRRAVRGAAQGGHRDLVEFFIETVGADHVDLSYESLLSAAIDGGHLDMVEWVLEQGFVDKDRHWVNEMCAAVRGGHRILVDFFIQRAGATTEGMGACDWNEGLCWAASGGHLDLIELFISGAGAQGGRGANDWARANEWAQYAYHDDLVKYFDGKIAGMCDES